MVSLAGAYDGCAGWGGGDWCGWEGKSIVLYASRPRYEIKVREIIFLLKNKIFYSTIEWLNNNDTARATDAGAIIL